MMDFEERRGAAEEASRFVPPPASRFREILASQLLSLERSLVSACEREMAHAGNLAVEFAQRQRPSESAGASGANSRRLELEVQRLRADVSERSSELERARHYITESRRLEQELTRLRTSAEGQAQELEQARKGAADAEKLEAEVRRLRNENEQLQQENAASSGNFDLHYARHVGSSSSGAAGAGDARRLEREVRRLRAENAELVRCTLQEPLAAVPHPSASSCDPAAAAAPASSARAPGSSRTSFSAADAGVGASRSATSIAAAMSDAGAGVGNAATPREAPAPGRFRSSCTTNSSAAAAVAANCRDNSAAAAAVAGEVAQQGDAKGAAAVLPSAAVRRDSLENSSAKKRTTKLCLADLSGGTPTPESRTKEACPEEVADDCAFVASAAAHAAEAEAAEARAAAAAASFAATAALATSAAEPRRRAATPTAARRSATPRRSQPPPAVTQDQNDVRTRMNYDKRTLRRMHRDAFMGAVQDWRAHHQVGSDHCGGGRSAPSRPVATRSCQVFVRVRPLFESERQKGEFEVVSAYEESSEIAVHNCLLQPDLVHKYVHHSGFYFSGAFGPAATNPAVHAACGAPLIRHALSGQLATLFMFGQTGSGKTFTMDALLQRASEELFSASPLRGGGRNASMSVRIKVFEIIGKKCLDLLSDDSENRDLRLLEDEEGRTNVCGAAEMVTRSPEELLRHVREGLAARAVAAHARNDESSRSHCVCRLEPQSGGALVLVDCAGTERRQDSEQHSVERVRESADINASLHALKECIRYWQSREQDSLRKASFGDGVADGDSSSDLHQDRRSGKEATAARVPFRGSQLTRVLQESFTRRGSLLVAIGTLSPAAMDTEHSLSTLRTLQMLQADPAGYDEKAEVVYHPPANLASSLLRRSRSSVLGDASGAAAQEQSSGPRHDAAAAAEGPSAARLRRLTPPRTPPRTPRR